jgi:hypothetical protein
MCNFEDDCGANFHSHQEVFHMWDNATYEYEKGNKIVFHKHDFTRRDDPNGMVDRFLIPEPVTQFRGDKAGTSRGLHKNSLEHRKAVEHWSHEEEAACLQPPAPKSRPFVKWQRRMLRRQEEERRERKAAVKKLAKTSLLSQTLERNRIKRLKADKDTEIVQETENILRKRVLLNLRGADQGQGLPDDTVITWKYETQVEKTAVAGMATMEPIPREQDTEPRRTILHSRETPQLPGLFHRRRELTAALGRALEETQTPDQQWEEQIGRQPHPPPAILKKITCVNVSK